MSNVQGPFGSYPFGTVGAVLNAAVRAERVPLSIVERLRVDGKCLLEGTKIVALYDWFDGLRNPVFRWTPEWRQYSKHSCIVDAGKLKFQARPCLTVHGYPGLQFQDDQATPEVHAFLCGMLTNNMRDPCYEISRNACSFFQSGYQDKNSRFFMIEFHRVSGVQVFVDYFNANFIGEYDD